MDKKMMTIDLNSKVLLDKAERDGVEYVEWGLVE